MGSREASWHKKGRRTYQFGVTLLFECLAYIHDFTLVEANEPRLVPGRYEFVGDYGFSGAEVRLLLQGAFHLDYMLYGVNEKQKYLKMAFLPELIRSGNRPVAEL